MIPQRFLGRVIVHNQKSKMIMAINMYRVSLMISVILVSALSIRAQELSNKLETPGLTSIKSSGSAEVVLIPSNIEYVSFEDTAEKLIYNVVYKHKTLHINSLGDNDGQKPFKVFVYSNNIKEVELREGSYLTSPVELSYSHLKLIAKESSRIDMRIKSSSVSIWQFDNSVVRLQGETVRLTLNMESASVFRGDVLKTDHFMPDITGTSKSYIHVEREINGTAANGTGIFYTGDPRRIRLSGQIGGFADGVTTGLVKLDLKNPSIEVRNY